MKREDLMVKEVGLENEELIQEKVELFSKNVDSEKKEWLDHNARVLGKIIRHFSEAFQVPIASIYSMCQMEKTVVNMETLRNNLEKGYME